MPVEAPPEAQFASRSDEIVGGFSDFSDPQIFMLEMTYAPDSVFLCSSTLIGRVTLVCAAHCIAPDELGRKPTVRAVNVPRVKLAVDSDWIKVVKQRYHPNYKALVIQNDISVLQLERQPLIKPKPWNRTNFSAELVGKTVRVAGYGITTTDGTGAGVKRSTELAINDIDPTLINFGITNQIGTCSGDSGGPMFYSGFDGIERQIGIHSFHRGECGKNADARIDKMADFVDQWFSEVEVPQCAEDGQCKSGCTPEDVDCTCQADNVCNPSCPAPAKDPDCAESCAGGGVCSTTACATPDPDCVAVGAPCGLDSQCAGRMCVSDPQNADSYCSKPCLTSADCATGFECGAANACTKIQKPTASDGQACTVGQTFCLGTRRACGGPEGKPLVCSRQCLFQEDCGDTESCTPSGAVSVCTANIVLKKADLYERAAKSCASVGPSAFAWLALVGLIRRRVKPGRCERH